MQWRLVLDSKSVKRMRRPDCAEAQNRRAEGDFQDDKVFTARKCVAINITCAIQRAESFLHIGGVNERLFSEDSI
jgi:hypothetical protein